MEIQQYVTQQQIAHDCPICGQAVYHNPKFPNQVCNACMMEVVDDEGNSITLFPSDYWYHKFETRNRHNDNNRHDHEVCYIHGHQCKIMRGEGDAIVIEKN
jgi:hypothetical protein